MADPTNNSMLSTVLTVAVSGNTLFNIGLSYVTWKLRTSAATVERLEAKVERTEAARDAKQHELTDKLIDARMRDFSHQAADLVNDLKVLSAAHKAMQAEFDEKVDRLGERDHAAELKVLGQIKDLQVEMAKNTPSKSDLEKHEASMRREMSDLKKEVREEIRKA